MSPSAIATASTVPPATGPRRGGRPQAAPAVEFDDD
eukprot:gene23222-17606_t